MKLNDYQAAALTTAVYPEDKRIIYPALGMSGEAGGVADPDDYEFFNGNYRPWQQD